MIDKRLILVEQNFKTQEEVFQKLSELVVENGYANSVDAVLAALRARESEGTTGMMDGFAIPHAKSDTILKPGVAVMKLQDGIDWDSMDGKTTNAIVALFIPESEVGATHLQLLSKLARLLMRLEFKETFANCHTVDELEKLLSAELK